MTRLLFFLIIFLAFDFYAFQSLRAITRNHWVTLSYVLCSVGVLGNFVYQTLTFDRLSGLNPGFYSSFALFVLLFVPKFILVGIMLAEDIFRLFEGLFNFLRSLKTEGKNVNIFSSRRKFVSQLALALASVPFFSILHGITKGKYNFKVLNYDLFFDDLPDEFEGYKITQISDIHCGSLDNKNKVEYAVDLINKQGSDSIMFTGDLVNSRTSELIPWKSTFSKLYAKDGVFSILGNHDYGDYTAWPSEKAKEKNFQDMIDVQKEMGFQLLLDEAKFISRKNSRLAIIGVENWGKGFKQKGNLKKATSKIDANDFKILLSHDPSHWNHEVIDDKFHYQLTLSGHTHGMQFGIEIPGFIKWSPIKWRYKYWAGLYEESGQILNVNRGFGYLAFPGRVGIWPEISVITLRKREQIT